MSPSDGSSNSRRLSERLRLPYAGNFQGICTKIQCRLDQSAFIVARRRPGLLVLNLGILQLRGVSGREPG